VKLTHVLKEHSGYVSSIQFLGKDEVVTSGGDGKVLFWDLESGKVKDEVQQAIGDVR
jgi:WD40 repeat protein